MNVPFYHLYEFNHATMGPARAAADLTRLYFQNPFNPLSQTQMGRSIAAACELFERSTRRYGKPQFDIETTVVSGVRVPVTETIVWHRPFCNLVHFQRDIQKPRRVDPKVLVVAPMSGHYATLLRGTVEALLPRHDVYITDWVDARMVPITDGRFDLDDYIDYVISMLHAIGEDAHVIAVCQPSVPVLAAVSVMEQRSDPLTPLTMTLMGGPVDTRCNPTAVNKLAEEKGVEWFARNVIMKVPFPHPGVYRDVYPGFLQLTGFMSMNLDRHVGAHKDFYNHLVKGDGDSAEKHRDFYDEYLAVMDLTAEFYLQTVEAVFVNHLLPKGEMVHRGMRVDPSQIRNCALLTIEGEKDDITGGGQTEAAHALCTGLRDDRKAHYTQPGVGHYGVFNGSRWRSEICPRIADFILTHNMGSAAARESARSSSRVSRPAVAAASSKGDAPTSEKTVAHDLKRIAGIGPKLERQLNEQGIFLFHQLAELTGAQVDELDQRLSTRGRIQRDDWVGQARRLMATV